MEFPLKHSAACSLFYFDCALLCLRSFAVAVVLSILFSSVASARLSGDASLTYNSYDGRTNGPNRMSSSSLLQNYSLLYSKDGLLYNSRVGNYRVALGYNFTTLDTTFKSSTQPTENYNTSRGHILFKGEINLDPREMPLKFNAYSRDLTSNTVNNSSGSGSQNFNSMFNRDQPTSINDGLHIESGATLVAGVKNGMTNGYNEILRHFPMILLDYKDTINRDLRSSNPINDRLSRLAFVSLNKKDNWFHYRHTQYHDYLNVSNDYVENQIQLGTIDQYMARRWIDFSNWIKVSTDLQLTKRKSNYQANPIEDINLNLFAAVERQSWNARTYTTFNRYRDENSKLSYQTSLPLFAAGVLSQDVSWNVRTSFRDNHDIDTLGVRSSFISNMAGYRVDAFKRAQFTLSQSLDVESAKSNLSDSLMLSGTLETTSTPRFSRDVTLGGSYKIKNSLTSSATASASDFLEQNLEIRGSYAASNTLRFSASQSGSFNKGSQTVFQSGTQNSQTLLSQYVSPRSSLTPDPGTQSYQLLSSFGVGWNPKPRLSTNLSVSEDIYKSNVLALNAVTNVSVGADYSNAAWSVSNILSYERGSREVLDENANRISDNAKVSYVHSRNLDASVGVTYSAYFSKVERVSGTEIVQRANYSYFTKSGISRKLIEFNETVMYSDGTNSNNNSFNKSLSLGFKYYPISRLTLAGALGYSYTTQLSNYTMIWNVSAAANFKLLQASLDYANGIRKIDGARESKFTGNIRRSF